MAKAKKTKIDWSGCNYESAEDLARKIDWEGGLVEFICGYNGGGDGLPEPLRSAADKLATTAQECEKVFSDAGALL